MPRHGDTERSLERESPTSQDRSPSPERKRFERERKRELKESIKEYTDEAYDRIEGALLSKRALTDREERYILGIIAYLDNKADEANNSHDRLAIDFYEEEANNLEKRYKECIQEYIRPVEEKARESVRGTPTQRKREDVYAFKTFASDGLEKSSREDNSLAAEIYKRKVEDADKLIGIMEGRIIV